MDDLFSVPFLACFLLNDQIQEEKMKPFAGCPGSQTLHFEDQANKETEGTVGKIESQLRQWPIQLHLISPLAPYYQGADVLLTADCVG